MSSESTQQTSNYEDTLKVLETLILTKPVQERAKDVRQMCNVEAMADYIKRLQLDISKLKFIHVAGTKGKGSTCAFCESILRHAGLKTGLYTSPHLIDVRERIRINGVPIGKELFVKQFWDCWKGLENTRNEIYPSMATYFRFLTLVAFKTFIDENVDVVIIEVGVGGRLDATNVITPQVCGISSIGWDHMDLLGDTLEKIASEKAGIMKKNIPVITYQQAPEVMQVFKDTASKVGANLLFAPTLDLYVTPFKNMQLGLIGDYQMQNASLALALCAEFWKKNNILKKPVLEFTKASVENVMGVPVTSPFVISDVIHSGLAQCKWPCRGQLVPFKNRNLLFFIDGAHTPESLELCAQTFKEASEKFSSNEKIALIPPSINDTDLASVSDDEETQSLASFAASKVSILKKEEEEGKNAAGLKKTLLFYYTGNRDPETLLKKLIGNHFDQVIFCLSDSQHSVLNKRNITTPDNKLVEDKHGNKERQKLEVLQKLWNQSSETQAVIIENINDVLATIFSQQQQQQSAPHHVLVTGSFYLAGDVLRKLIKITKLNQ